MILPVKTGVEKSLMTHLLLSKRSLRGTVNNCSTSAALGVSVRSFNSPK